MTDPDPRAMLHEDPAVVQVADILVANPTLRDAVRRVLLVPGVDVPSGGGRFSGHPNFADLFVEINAAGPVGTALALALDDLYSRGSAGYVDNLRGAISEVFWSKILGATFGASRMEGRYRLLRALYPADLTIEYPTDGTSLDVVAANHRRAITMEVKTNLSPRAVKAHRASLLKQQQDGRTSERLLGFAPLWHLVSLIDVPNVRGALRLGGCQIDTIRLLGAAEFRNAELLALARSL